MSAGFLLTNDMALGCGWVRWVREKARISARRVKREARRVGLKAGVDGVGDGGDGGG